MTSTKKQREYEWSKIPSILKTGQFLQNIFENRDGGEEEVLDENHRISCITCPCVLDSFTEEITSTNELVNFIQTLKAFCLDNITKELCQNKTCLKILFDMRKEEISSLMSHDQIAQCTDIVDLLKIFLKEKKENWFASSGNLNCLTYILDENVSHEKDNICYIASSYGHLDCLIYAHEHGCPWDEKTCCIAGMNGHLDCLTYTHEHGCPWDSETCSDAASYGHLNCLTYAHEHGCPWDEWTCACASSAGHLDCLAYTHEHGCPWDERTCYYAGMNGYLNCLKYAHEHGCPWDTIVCYLAEKFGQWDCLTYAHEHECPWNEETCSMPLFYGLMT